ATAVLKKEAQATVELIGRQLEQRQQRQRQQLKDLGARLLAVKTELHEGGDRLTLDSLTRLYSRSTFEEQLVRLAELGHFVQQPPCLLLLGVEQMSAILAAHGQACAEEVLRQVARSLLRHCFRREDFVARLDGDEFGVLMLGPSLNNAQGIAQRILGAVRGLSIE